MDKRDLALAILGLCALFQLRQPIADAGIRCREGGAQMLFRAAHAFAKSSYTNWVLDATSEYAQIKRYLWYNTKTLGGWLDTTRGKIAELDGLAGVPECVDPSWRDYLGLAFLFLLAITAILCTLTALKFACIYMYNKGNWAGVRYLLTTVAMGFCFVTGAYNSPDTAMSLGVLCGLILAKRRMSNYSFHPMPTLNYTDPDTRGIVISESSLPPPRNVGYNEMAIPGVQTNKTDLTKAPFAFLICSEKWDSVIGMGFRVEIDGKDVLVTVLHVHAAWAQRKAEGGYMHIYGKNGRATFKPEVVFASRALDLVYYKYPSTIGAAGIAKGKHYSKDTSGSAVWVLSPALKGDTMLESSCASMRSYAPYHITHWASTRPGSSGSPIYTKDGIVGVHRGSDGIRANYGVYLFTNPAGKSGFLETSAPKVAHYDYDSGSDFAADEEIMTKARKRIAEAREWALDQSDDIPWMETSDSASPLNEGGRREFDPPGMCPVFTGPWFLDTIQNGEVIIYPVGFRNRLSVGKPITKASENVRPAQKASPASGITVGSSEIGKSSSPDCETTPVQDVISDVQASEKRISSSLESVLTRVAETQAQMVLELRALKEQQPSVQSSTGGASQTGVQQQSTLPSSTKPAISKRAAKRARQNASKSLNGSLSATPVVIEQTRVDTSKSGAT